MLESRRGPSYHHTSSSYTVAELVRVLERAEKSWNFSKDHGNSWNFKSYSNSNTVTSNFPLSQTQNIFFGFVFHSFTIDYFKLPQFRSILRFPCLFEIAGFNCDWSTCMHGQKRHVCVAVKVPLK